MNIHRQHLDSVRRLLLVELGQQELGERIKLAREDAKLSQRDLADAIGLRDAQSISNYERGITEVPPKRLRRIADTTKKPLEFFVQEPSQDGHGATSREEQRDSKIAAEIAHLAQVVEALAAEQRRQADEIVELRQELAPTLRKA